MAGPAVTPGRGPGRVGPAPRGPNVRAPNTRMGGHQGRGGQPHMSPLLNPDAPLKGNSLYQAAQSLAQAQYQPTISALQGQIGLDDQQTQNAENLISGYYKDLQGQVQQNVANQGTISNNLNSQLQAISNSENQQLGSLGSNALSMQQKYAPQSDQSSSLDQAGMSSLASEIARQQGLAAQNEGAMQGYGATQGANAQLFANQQGPIFAQAGDQNLRSVAQAGIVKNEPLTNRLASTIASEGALTSADEAKLRQNEIANEIARGGLGIKQETANAALINAGAHVTSANASARNAGTRASQNAFNQSLKVGSPAWARVQNAQGKQWSDNPNAVGSPAWSRAVKSNATRSGGAKPLTTLENNHFWGTMGQIEQLIQNGQHSGGSEAQIRQGLGSGGNPSKRTFDPFMVNMAYELLGYGAISRQTAAVLHNQYGVRGGTFRGQPVKVGGQYSGTLNNAANTTNGAVNQAVGGVLNGL